MCQNRVVGLVEIFSLFIEMEVLDLLRITPLFVPVADEGLGLELAGVIRCLFDDEVSIHSRSYKYYFVINNKAKNKISI